MLIETPLTIQNMQSVCQQTLAHWTANNHKVFVFRATDNLGDLRDFYQRFVSLLGSIGLCGEDVTLGDRSVQHSGQSWSEVRFDPQFPNAFRHTANAQPLHTDGSYVADYDSSLMYCLANCETGGETVFVDSQALVDDLAKHQPSLLAKLTSEIIPHARSGDARNDKVLQLKAQQWLVNWNYYCVSEAISAKQSGVVEEFQHYLCNAKSLRPHIQAIKLGPGDAVLWRDNHVLHGRNAFTATKTSERFLYKCGLVVGQFK